MHIVRLKISGFRGVRTADISLGRHTVLVGPNNSGKTTIIEALALLFGRDRLVRRLTEHDFHGSAPDEQARILCIATVAGFTPNDPHHHSSWFSPERGVEKWFDPNTKTLSATPDAQHTDLAVQIGFSARFDLDELEAETLRFFVDDEATLGDPFAEDAHLRTIHTKVLQELGFFLVPASRTWDRWISFSSELFRRVVATRGDMPAQPTNHQQHLLFAWRQKLVAALMHECVLIPEGVSDVAWLEALQTSLELHQGWEDAGNDAPLLSTFVGVVPTIDAKIADTFALVSAVHARPCILVDGDNDGHGYFDAVKVSNPPPRAVVFWPQSWSMEHVVSWVAGADEAAMLAALGTTLGQAFADRAALTAHLLTQKSYGPTHESAAVTLMANAACRARAARLLNALCEVLRDPANANTPLFTRVAADSTATMHVFRFVPI